MYSVTQVLQRCKENNEKTPGISEKEFTRCFQFDPRRFGSDDFVDAFVDCDNNVAMEYLQSISDIHFFPRINMCPTSEIRRIVKLYNPNQCLTTEQKVRFRQSRETKILTLEQLEQETGLSPVIIGGGRGGFVMKEGESSSLLTYLPNKEMLWSPRACLMLMVRASDFQKRGRDARPLCDKVRRDMMVAAYQLAEEAKRKEAEEAKRKEAEEASRRRAEERFQKVLDAQKKEAEKAAVAEQHTSTEKPKPEPQPESRKVSDDSKVVINMTPDLLTVMIKTAVTESVNAVWQKFMDNREIFMNT